MRVCARVCVCARVRTRTRTCVCVCVRVRVRVPYNPIRHTVCCRGCMAMHPMPHARRWRRRALAMRHMPHARGDAAWMGAWRVTGAARSRAPSSCSEARHAGTTGAGRAVSVAPHGTARSRAHGTAASRARHAAAGCGGGGGRLDLDLGSAAGPPPVKLGRRAARGRCTRNTPYIGVAISFPLFGMIFPIEIIPAYVLHTTGRSTPHRHRVHDCISP